MRGLLLSFALAAAGVPAAVPDPPPPASGEVAALNRWLGANIKSQGWEIADVSRDEALYIQTGLKSSAGAANVTAYVRWERFAPSTAAEPWRSALQRLEIDCASGRFRELSWSAYARSNFGGAVIENSPDEAEPWRTVADGSIMLAVLAKACPGRVVQSPAPAQSGAGVSAPSR